MQVISAPKLTWHSFYDATGRAQDAEPISESCPSNETNRIAGLEGVIGLVLGSAYFIQMGTGLDGLYSH